MVVQASSGSSPPPTFRDEALLNTSEAAKKLGLSASWLTKARMSGDGPPYLKICKRVLYRPSDLWTWLEAHHRRSTSDAA
jgi:hypothetical protein